MSANRRDWNRRDILRLAGLGGVVFASGMVGCASAPATLTAGRTRGPELAPNDDFFFLQLSDTHWGFKGAPNPEADLTLKQTVAAIKAIESKPDFIVFTGDLTHTTDDPKERRARMAQFKEIIAPLEVKTVFLPGEHDASLDRGEAYLEAFGALHHSFDHKGVHFVAIDNVSDASGVIGDAQLDWLANDLAKVPAETPVIVLTHRPLFDLYPQWEWATKDGESALEILAKRASVTVFYGHIHQEHHHTTGAITHHSARSLVFPLPAPGSVPKKAPLPWDPSRADHGLGYRAVKLRGRSPIADEIPFRRA